MKACILSMQKINNMGSLLQAYGLKRMLETLGCEVEYKDIKKIQDDYNLLGDFVQDYSKENERRGVIGKIFRIDRYFINRLLHKKAEKEQVKIFEQFRSKVLKTNKKSERYDLCVIGSDEVFNCMNAGFWGFSSQLFGNVPEANKVITYAASCGTTKYCDLPEKVINRVKDTFDNVSAFSVRDLNTLDFVSHLCNKNINQNLDPVLVHDFCDEIGNIDIPTIEEKFCIVYSYRNRIHDSSEIYNIKKFCMERGLKLIAIGAPQFWIKDYIVCTPFQCLKMFEKADFVITDTFHGTIFSTKYTSKFAVLMRDSNKNKLEDLVKRLSIENNLIKEFTELEKVYNVTKMDSEITQIISEQQEKTMKYLKGNI